MAPTLRILRLPIGLVMLGWLGVACAEPAAEEVTTESDAIVGGRLTTSAHPAIGYLADRDEDSPFCTATLVDAHYIVTAAHCLVGVRATTLVFGTGKFNTTLHRTALKRCKKNTRYHDTDASSVYDFAFCELKTPVDDITPMPFEPSPAFGAKHLGLGYGMTDAEDPDSVGPRKQLALKRVSSDGEPLLEGFEDMLATTSPRGDLCFGDSGSPLVVFGTDNVARLAGVLHGGVTDGDSDCAGGNISLYAPISANAAFYASR